MSKMLKKVYAAKRNINYDGGSKKSGTGAGIGRSGGLSRLVASQSSNNNNRLSLGITPVLTYRSNNVFTVNTTINVNDEIKPTLTGVTGTITYAISEELPNDMNFNTVSGKITGTPRISQVEKSYTVTASNTDGIIIISNAFTIRINDVAPSFTYSSSSIGTVGILFSEIGPSPATSGTGSITYAISGALPTGMNFSTATGKITGTPTTSQVSTSYTVTATNTGATFTCAPFTIRVNDVAPSFTYSSSIGTVNSVFTEIGPSHSTIGTGIITYAISGALPTGMNFSTATGKITGTPTTSQVSTSYTVTATNTGATFTCDPFTIRVNDVAPSFTYPSSSIGTVNRVFTEIGPSPATSGTGTIEYTISGALPTGLAFNNSTGKITGTPTTIQVSTSYTVTATNTGATFTCAPFTITTEPQMIVYAATANGLSISTDINGATPFTNYTTGLGTNAEGQPVVKDVYVVGSTIYAATAGGVSISTDNGATSFTNKTIGLGSPDVTDVYVVGSTIYAATAGGVSISTDINGATPFTNYTNGLGNTVVHGVYVVGSTIYAATGEFGGGGLSISTNDGTSFTNYTNNLSNAFQARMRCVYVVDSTIYVGTNGGLGISTDNGATPFTKYTNGLGSTVVNGVYVVGSTIYAATNGGLSISTDNGTSFTNYTAGLGTNAEGQPVVHDVYVVGSTIYAATAGGLSISTDNGAISFTNYTAGLGSPVVYGVYVAPMA